MREMAGIHLSGRMLGNLRRPEGIRIEEHEFSSIHGGEYIAHGDMQRQLEETAHILDIYAAKGN